MRVLLGVLAVLLLAPVTAQAHTVTGGQSDPLGDGGSLDAQRIEVTYDDEAGALDVLVRVDPDANPVDFGGGVALTLGSASRNGGCVAAAADLRMDAWLTGDMTYGSLFAADEEVAAVAGPDTVIEAFPTYVFSFRGGALAGKSIRCVTGIVLGSGESADRVDEFCLGGACVAAAVEPVDPTPAAEPTPQPASTTPGAGTTAPAANRETPVASAVTPDAPVEVPATAAPATGQGTVTTTPVNRSGLSVAAAKSRAADALARRFKQDFAKKARGSYRAACRRVDASTVDCRVRWTTARTQFRGTVRVAGTRSTVAVKRAARA